MRWSLKRFKWRPSLIAADRTTRIDLELGLRKFDVYRHLTLFTSNGDLKRLSTLLYNHVRTVSRCQLANNEYICSLSQHSGNTRISGIPETASTPRLNNAVTVPLNDCLVDRLPCICIRTLLAWRCRSGSTNLYVTVH